MCDSVDIMVGRQVRQGRQRLGLTQVDLAAACGISVQQNSASAINNYWGSPQGPGANPADHVGEPPLCDGTIPNNDAGLPVTKPFATQPLGVL